MKRMTLSFIVALAFIVLGIVGLTVALKLPFSNPVTKIGGPGTFPAAFLVIIITLSIILAVTELAKSFYASGSPESGSPTKMEKKDVTRILLLVAAAVIYTLSLNTAGFMISTVILTAVLLFLFGYRNMIISPILAIGFPALLYLLFRTVLKISLP